MHFDCDVCIVGAGPAGLSIARVLARRGISVTVVESGRRNGSASSREPSAGRSVGYPYHPLHKAHSSGVGGSTQIWRGSKRFRPLDAIDFESRPGIPHSGWPFGLDQLLPYYQRAQELLPLGPFEYNTESWEDPDTTPRLPLPVEQIETAVFQATAGGDSGAKAIAALADDPTYRILTDTTVTELITAEDGTRVASARLLHSDGTRTSLDAGTFVLAAGGFDNTRLLLMSNERWPRGLGNLNDLVGRYFMEHPAVTTAYWVPSDAIWFDRIQLYEHHTVRGTPIVGTLSVQEDLKRQEGLLNAAVFLHESDDQAVGDVYNSLSMFSPKGLQGVRWTPSMYAANLANLVRHPMQAMSAVMAAATGRGSRRRKVLAMRVVSEQAPNPDSRVTLDTRLDDLGLPELKLDWRFTDLDRWSIRRSQEIIRDSFRQAGLGEVKHLYGEERPPARIYGQRHQIGTTRMHVDQKKGVVDADCRVHGLHNLYVAGSSVFPTGGHANTTLTIVAMALRLAAHIEALYEDRAGISF